MDGLKICLVLYSPIAAGLLLGGLVMGLEALCGAIARCLRRARLPRARVVR